MSALSPQSSVLSPVRIGVFGGTFDPPHLGHLVLAEAARDQLALDRVLLVVAGEPWRKSGTVVTEASQRLEMVRRAVAGNPSLEASDVEVRRTGPSYTAETLRELSAPDRDIFLILGEDAARDLPNWRTPREILHLATLAIAQRGSDSALAALEGARTVSVEMPRLEISSTDIRRRVGSGQSIRYLVPAAVQDYIESTGLYRAPTSS